MESDLETVTCELTTKTVGLLHRTWMCLKWYPAGQPDQRLDWVGLWDHEPVNTDGWLRSDWVEGYPDGSFVTSEELDPSKTYWMAYCRRDSRWGADKILCKQRFMWHPHWMADLGERIEEKKLRELVLPASHDAGTYWITPSSPFSPDFPEKDRWNIGKPEISHWVRTQEMNMEQQLNAGYRCLDLRVAKFDGDFWIFSKIERYCRRLH